MITLWEAHKQAEQEAISKAGTSEDALFERCKNYRLAIQPLIPSDLHRRIDEVAQRESGYRTGKNRAEQFAFYKLYRRKMTELAEKNRQTQHAVQNIQPSCASRILRIVAEYFPGVNVINRESRFVEDLGASVHVMGNLLGRLEEEFDVVIPDNVVEGIQTAGNAIDVLESLAK